MRSVPDSDESRSMANPIDTTTQPQAQLAAAAAELERKLRGTAVQQLVERLDPQQAGPPADDAVDLYA
jgi:hypothetical protein